MIELSVVIPTHQRPQILCRTLEHIAAQTVIEKLEVIVISDGPGDETEHMIFSRSKGSRVTGVFYWQKGNLSCLLVMIFF
jgi:glycosyltransferase involved in cell wall biosynthesis